mgnify:CR=1 FL=1
MGNKQKRTFDWYTENQLFYLYLMLLIIYLVMTGIPVIIHGINQTISWRWYLTSIDFIITYYTLGIYLVGLIILLIFKRKTKKIISKFFLLGLLIIFLWDSIYGMNYLIVGYFKIFIFLLFITIIVTSKSKKEIII